jgi:hypothetical protein
LPAPVNKMPALAVALQIEMALLNCSHIVAVYTDNTPGSTWVPYEYGRVKEPVLSSTKCCTWFCIRNANTIQPEWLELNEKRHQEKLLTKWFEREFKNWPYRGNLSKPAKQWVGNVPPALPNCP